MVDTAGRIWLLAADRYGYRYDPWHDAVERDQVFPGLGRPLERGAGVVDALLHARHDVAFLLHLLLSDGVALPVEDVGVVGGDSDNRQHRSYRHPLAGTADQTGNEPAHAFLPAMCLHQLARLLRRRELRQQQRNEGGGGRQQGQHAEHAEVRIGLVEGDIDGGQGGKAHHVGHDGERGRDYGVADGYSRRMVAVTALAMLQQESSCHLYRVADADGEQ